jgi:hypothetical protein
MKRSLLSLCLLAALAVPPAYAADPALEARLKALETRVTTLEKDAAAQKQRADEATAQLEATRAELAEIKSAPPVATDNADSAEARAAAVTAPGADTAEAGAEAVAASPESADSGATQSNSNAMNPAISIILNGEYAHHSLAVDQFVRAGFPLAGDAGPGPQGLSLGETEISFASNIDEKFYGQATVSVGSDNGQDSIGLEEAYIETTTLPDGFTLKAGRFLSNLGYLNHHHAHTDKFGDRPLPLQAFLGGSYHDDGVQLRWVAPTDTFLEVGGEILRGQNFPSGGAGHAGAGVKTLFAHVGGDVGSESSWLAGVSALDSQTEGGEDGFTGHERLYIADGTWKWAPGGNTKDGGITLRGEYFLEHRDGDYIDPDDPLVTAPWTGSRRGAYLEGVWRINRQWETGYRYDKLWSGNGNPFDVGFDPGRHSLMLAWLNSEFSLFRVQLSREDANPDDSDTAVTLQYQTSLGAHGAHKF